MRKSGDRRFSAEELKKRGQLELDYPKKKSKPFKICMGDTFNLVEKLKSEEGDFESKIIINHDNWELWKTSQSFYWILGEKPKSITHQWMSCSQMNPQIYIFFNYRDMDAKSKVIKCHELVKKDTRYREPYRYCLVGYNYNDGVKKHKILRKDILEYCLNKLGGEDNSDYIDLEDMEL